MNYLDIFYYINLSFMNYMDFLYKKLYFILNSLHIQIYLLSTKLLALILFLKEFMQIIYFIVFLIVNLFNFPNKYIFLLFKQYLNY
jgi:hypothetical protein